MDITEKIEILEGKKEFKGKISEEAKRYVDTVWNEAFKSDTNRNQI